MPLLKKIGAVAMATVIAATTLISPTAADEAYYGYSYDWWNDPVPSQNGYIVDEIITGVDLGVGTFNELNDIFVDDVSQKIYLVDTSNNRIIITEETFDPEKVQIMDTFSYSDEFPEQNSIVKQTTLNKPRGVFVIHHNDQTLIYIADFSNSRVLACYEDGTIFAEYTRPSSDLYDSEVSFNPSKVVVDKALNVYVVIPSITTGMVQFSFDGSFNGFYGANRVQTTAEVLENAFYGLFMSREQMQKRRRSVAIEITNVDIDEQGFIYTVTASRSSEVDILKKLNPAGENIYINLGLDGFGFGDTPLYYDGKNYASSIEDVDVDENGNVFLLDFSEKRIFQLSDELDLEFIFGGEGSQKGLFTSPSAVENLNTRVYVTDARKNSITIFKLTEFGALVQGAIELFNRGLYTEAKEPFEEVLMRDSNYWFAYLGLGNAYYTLGDYQTAMDYFYMHGRGGYNRAFTEFRTDFVRANFSYFILAILVLIVLAVVLSKVLKMLKKKKAAKAVGGDSNDEI